MKTIIFHLRITPNNGKSFLTQTREQGIDFNDCKCKALSGWVDTDIIEITAHYLI